MSTSHRFANSSRRTLRTSSPAATPPREQESALRQRGYYSDIVSKNCNVLLNNSTSSGPCKNTSVSWKTAEIHHSPKVTTFKEQGNTTELVKKNAHGPTTAPVGISEFPLKSWEPKVQLPFKTEPNQVPRKIEIERRKRAYAEYNITKLIEESGVCINSLMPSSEIKMKIAPGAKHLDADCDPFLPLEVFDNTEYDSRTPREWLALGKEPDGQKPVPGKALLPSGIVKDGVKQYEWVDIGMTAYDKKQKLYQVQHMPRGAALSKSASPKVKRKAVQFWVPRIRLMFCAEDPVNFARRVVDAFELRRKTEVLLRYHLYIDCMPTDGVPDISAQSLRRIIKWSKGSKMSSNDLRTSECIDMLTKQIQLDYMRTMNKITFDKMIRTLPDMFAFVEPQDPEMPIAPENALCSDVPSYNFEEKFRKFSFRSLLTLGEVIQALVKVRTECNKVIAMTLFQAPISKSMRLEEFEQAQGQASSQVQMFLKDSWLTTLRAVVRSSLRDIGKGWFNLEETNWEVYRMSKISKLMESVRFMMQDSLRYLVQHSLKVYTHMILDACKSVMKIADDFTWTGGILKSSYMPKKNPIFFIDLVMEANTVTYSTAPESFEPSVIGCFDKGIQAAKNVPQLEKHVMERLFWSGTPLLESVGENESEVKQLREAIRNAIQRAIIPLKAYAKEYEQYLDLYNLDIKKFLEDYEKEEHTPTQVKQLIENHMQEKEVIESSVPASIVIGPFWITCEGVRQALAKKKKALANSILEFLAKKLRKQADQVCDEFRTIARRLYDKPNCIEELSEQREYMKTVPGLLVEKQELINKAMIDYELLEEFWYSIGQDDFNAKYTCVGWPHKIEVQLEATAEHLEDDEERFQKNLLNEQNTFQDRLDALNMVIAGFSAHTDINKAHETANEVRRVTKQLKECQQLSQLYNSRERLFGIPVTNYEKLVKLTKDFEPFKNLWITTSDWLKWHDSWMNDPLNTIDAEQVEKNVNESYKTMHKCARHFQDIPSCQDVAVEIKSWIEEFKPFIPLIQALRNPGMRQRHWDQLSGELGVKIYPKSSLTFSKCLEMKLQDRIDVIAKVGEVAGKEYSIEQALDKMEQEWNPVNLDIMPYKETGTYIMKIGEELSQLLDDHIVMTQSMSFSPYKKVFEDRINNWDNKLQMTQDVIDEWLMCQRSWLYLEPIFSSEDINRQLPVESKRYQTMERIWRKIMNNAKNNTKVISFCSDQKLLENLRECNKLLEQVQKGLSDYLETKRTAFPRFYFLSDDELLEILSQTKDPTAVQPHLRKCFENIAKLKFEDDLRISNMYSAEGEMVKFAENLYPTGNVEDWLLEVENTMKSSLREILFQALQEYAETPRPEWVLQWPGQVVIAGCQTYWTSEVSESLEEDSLEDLYEHLQTQLGELVAIVRGSLTNIARLILSALIVIEVHACDVVAKLINENVKGVNDFEWISQLRYYWEEDLMVKAVNASFNYGYEYLGNSGRLVITPLTDRCYLTLTGALHLNFGGAPAGPAGTGKTETTKDLAKAMAIQCVVFNCSDQLDYMAMGKFFKGLASSGAWACFDEFNRIDIEVLSVVAQQITTIQQAQIAKVDRFLFEKVEIALRHSCAVFITMNPGYAGRTELPDNLKALFRPVAMMVPDYAMIAEISLYSFGFSEAKVLAKKITTTFKLSSEQLSSQDHYDFGMRAVKTVISAAGNLKRENPNTNEELICLRAIRDVNVPKFLSDDLKLFDGIVSDLFPTIKEEPIDYGSLEESIRLSAKKMNLQDVDGFVTKCIQLYETTVVRHGLMLVGPTGSGKTKCYEVLKKAMTSLKGQRSPAGSPFEEVHTFVLNPKSITMGQLYGEFDLLTHEWTDGILSSLVRGGASSSTTDKKWYVFDGPVDAVWIENMNTVLDDNKKLCLTSGEIIKLSESMTMMFEVQDLAVASPATVSRCGMVYLEPSILGLNPFVKCWMQKLPDCIFDHRETLNALFDNFLEESISFVRKNVKEYIPTMDSNLTFSLMRLLDCFFEPFTPKETETLSAEKINAVPKLLEPWFIFSLIWSVGATCDGDGRRLFSNFLRRKIESENIALKIPDEGLVYDYRFDDGGISNSGTDDDDEAGKRGEMRWINWMKNIPVPILSPEMSYSDIIVPTMDFVRGAYLIEKLLMNNKKVLCVGPTGSGKTLCISNKLLSGMPQEYMSHFISFSARTSANQTQDMIDAKLDKRRKGMFGPPLGKSFVLFIDDLNMPAVEIYGAQPPIELLRQYCDHGGWYDRKQIGAFKELVDINLLGAMGPPGGGRNPLTPRLTRHFNLLSFCEMEDASKMRIFSTILNSWIEHYTGSDKEQLGDVIVEHTIAVYNTITTQLLPTPAKSHYTFNLRDLSKVFQGILMSTVEKMESKEDILRLWYHENCRTFQDRLVNSEDREWFQNVLHEKLTSAFDVKVDDVLTHDILIYGDFMVPNADVKIYSEVTDFPKLKTVLEEYLEDYNQVNTSQMRLVLFTDAIQHISRISRIIRQPLGNALLLGVGGSGRQSLTRLATHMAEYELFQIELSKNYGISDWRDDVKQVLMKAGLENNPIVFLFCDTQIKSETFLEDINGILNSGDVPNIYTPEELDNIYNAMKPIVVDEGLQATKANFFSCYTKRIKANIHLVICMSPIGEIFRARLRQFPSLVTCCTIDWFSEWPDQALKSVANTFLMEMPEIDPKKINIAGLVNLFGTIHQSVSKKSLQYLHELSRHNYVTPTSYLELLGTFSKVLGIKKSEIQGSRNRTKTGLDKLLSTQKEVTKLQEELEIMQPLLAQAAQETQETMEQIKKDSVIANETKEVVSKEEREATKKAEETQEIADDAQKDLNEALPALEAALTSLKSLNRNDVVEVRALQRPPPGVKMVIEAVCIMKGLKPKKVAGDKPGIKVDDYWEAGRGLLQDPGKFLDSLFAYDKDNIPDSVIQKIQPYIDNEDFQPFAIQKVSRACTSICQWVRAMHKYHFVAKNVAPKREALRVAQEELQETQRLLDAAKARLADVEEGIASLQAKYEECIAKKQDLEFKTEQCTARLGRAEKLISGLSDEQGRWEEAVRNFDKLLVNIVGDIVISSGFIAYLGVFTGEYRNRLVDEWKEELYKEEIPHSENCTLVGTLGDPVKIRNWQIAGLPRDTLSVDNGIIVQFSKRWPLFIDPQGQANKWIRSQEKDAGIEIIKLSDRDFLRSLENSVRFGKPCLLENVHEELDPALEPILLKQVFKQQGSSVIKLGDTIIPYHEDFRFYVTTKLPNPHYTPEVSTKVTVVNFTLSPSGLEDQLLALVVAEERPDLEEAKNQLIISNAKMKQELKAIEDKILHRLSSSEGSPVDDIDLIHTLEQSKIKSQEIKAKVVIAEQTEKDIDATRSQYIPVSIRTQILFFCTYDLANIDPMYQYSLEWFVNIFLKSIANADAADNVVQRIKNINNYFTFSLYSNVCRSLFEKHKLLFAFLVTVRILMNENRINMEEWRFLLAGGTIIPNETENPAKDWLSERPWREILMLSNLPKFSTFAEDFSNHLEGFKRIFDSGEPHREPLPGDWDTELDSFQKILVLRCLRADKVTNSMQDFVASHLGQKFIEPQTTDLSLVFKDSSPTTPLIFVLSPGTDPAADLYKFAEEMRFSKKLSAISLGQGQVEYILCIYLQMNFFTFTKFLSNNVWKTSMKIIMSYSHFNYLCSFF